MLVVGRKKGLPAFRGKSKIISVYVTRETELMLKSRSKKTGFSVSDLIEYCWFVAGPGATVEALERFRTSAPPTNVDRMTA